MGTTASTAQQTVSAGTSLEGLQGGSSSSMDSQHSLGGVQSFRATSLHNSKAKSIIPNKVAPVVITNSVIAMDLAISKEMDTFHPHKQTRLYGITIALSQCPQGHNYCSVNNGGCTHLCLPTPGSRTCRCPDNTLGVDCIERK